MLEAYVFAATDGAPESCDVEHANLLRTLTLLTFDYGEKESPAAIR
jgi:hypothetical protein